MTLKDQISADLKSAMRAGDAKKRDAIRLLTSEMKRREVDDRKDLSDADVIAIIDKMIKQRRDSIAQFDKGGRQDLADNERFELTVLQVYMPQGLSDEEIAVTVEASIAEAGAKGASDMGKVMALLKGKLAGRADMARVSALVKAKLTG